MTKALKEFDQEVEQKKGRITELENDIRANKTALADKEKEYKEAVANDSNNIDDLFYEIERLQGKIKADEHKLGTLRTVTDEHLKRSALNVLSGFNSDVNSVYVDKLEKINEQIRKAKADYIKMVDSLQDEAYTIIDERNDKTRDYGKLMYSNNLSKQEVNQIHGNLYRELDNARYGAFKKMEVEFATVNEIEVKN